MSDSKIFKRILFDLTTLNRRQGENTYYSIQIAPIDFNIHFFILKTVYTPMCKVSRVYWSMRIEDVARYVSDRLKYVL